MFSTANAGKFIFAQVNTFHVLGSTFRCDCLVLRQAKRFFANKMLWIDIFMRSNCSPKGKRAQMK